MKLIFSGNSNTFMSTKTFYYTFNKIFTLHTVNSCKSWVTKKNYLIHMYHRYDPSGGIKKYFTAVQHPLAYMYKVDHVNIDVPLRDSLQGIVEECVGYQA